jgi:hypothetical protein
LIATVPSGCTTPEAVLTFWSNVFGVGPEMTTCTVLTVTPPGSVNIRPTWPVFASFDPAEVLCGPLVQAATAALPRASTRIRA